MTFAYVSAEQMADPGRGDHSHFQDYWWQYVPDKGFVFTVRGQAAFPHCNPDRRITERLLRYGPPGVEVRLLASAFVPRDLGGRHRLPGAES